MRCLELELNRPAVVEISEPAPVRVQQNCDVHSPAEAIEFPNGQLRRWALGDAERLHSLIEASRDHLRPFLPWASTDPSDLSFREEWLARAIEDFDHAVSFGYGIFEPDGRLIGGCGIHPVDTHSATIGYWVGSSDVRRGFATGAASALTDVALSAGWTRIIIRHDEANLASRAIAERLGFELIRSEPHSIDAPSQTGTTLVWNRT